MSSADVPKVRCLPERNQALLFLLLSTITIVR